MSGSECSGEPTTGGANSQNTQSPYMADLLTKQTYGQEFTRDY